MSEGQSKRFLSERLQRELLDSQSNSASELQRIVGSNTAETISAAVLALHGKGVVRKEQVAHLRSIYETLGSLDVEPEQDESRSLLKGGLGYLLLSFAVESHRDMREGAPVHSLQEEADALLCDQSVTDYILTAYEVDTALLDLRLHPAFRFHRSGTTSIILRVPLKLSQHSNSKAALKLIKMRHFDNTRIGDETEAYGLDLSECTFGNESVAPPIYAQNRRHILMAFIVGKTLREYMDEVFGEPGEQRKAHYRTAHRAQRLTLAKRVVTGLIDMLMTLPRAHLDLSPENVILTYRSAGEGSGEHDGSDIERMWLIDFGFNYLLNDGIGTGQQVAQLQSYVAPELFEGDSGSSLSDIYSIGSMLLELVSGRRLDPQKKAYRLDDVWTALPVVARLIEDMIDGKPQNRLAGCAKRDRESIYEYLQTELCGVYDVLEASRAMTGASRAPIIAALDGGVGTMLGLFFGKLSEAFRVASVSSGEAGLERASVFRGLAIAQAVNIALLFVIGSHIVADIQNGTFWEHAAARFVCLTFAWVATTYYANIFSSIYAWRVNRAVHLWIRFNSFCFAIPILYATVWDTSAWPWCAAIGVGFVATNNAINYYLARHAKGVQSEVFDLPESGSIDTFFKFFFAWWWTMGAYAVVLIVAFYLLKSGLAGDELIYGLVAAVVVNVLILGVANSIQMAPVISTGLNRLYFRLGRALAMQVETPLD